MFFFFVLKLFVQCCVLSVLVQKLPSQPAHKISVVAICIRLLLFLGFEVLLCNDLVTLVVNLLCLLHLLQLCLEQLNRRISAVQ